MEMEISLVITNGLQSNKIRSNQIRSDQYNGINMVIKSDAVTHKKKCESLDEREEIR